MSTTSLCQHGLFYCYRCVYCLEPRTDEEDCEDRDPREGKMKVTDTFVLSPNASRRTKQRYRAHEQGRCNSKCRWCAQGVPIKGKWYAQGERHAQDGPVEVSKMSKMEDAYRTLLACGPEVSEHLDGTKRAAAAKLVSVRKPVKKMAAKKQVRRMQTNEEGGVKSMNTEYEGMPTAAEVLEREVTDHYYPAARQVARAKAQQKIWAEALTPGMECWHRYHYRSCILLEQTGAGVWTIQLRDGSIEQGINAAILTPIKPGVIIRAWMALARTLHNTFYQEVEVATPAGVVTHLEFNTKLVASLLLGLVGLVLACYGYQMSV